MTTKTPLNCTSSLWSAKKFIQKIVYGHVFNLIANAVPSLSSWEEHSKYKGVVREHLKTQRKVTSLSERVKGECGHHNLVPLHHHYPIILDALERQERLLANSISSLQVQRDLSLPPPLKPTNCVVLAQPSNFSDTQFSHLKMQVNSSTYFRRFSKGLNEVIYSNHYNSKPLFIESLPCARLTAKWHLSLFILVVFPLLLDREYWRKSKYEENYQFHLQYGKFELLTG